jgi:hypothetical protein
MMAFLGSPEILDTWSELDACLLKLNIIDTLLDLPSSAVSLLVISLVRMVISEDSICLLFVMVKFVVIASSPFHISSTS